MYFTTVGAENNFDKLIFLLSHIKFFFQRKITFSQGNFSLLQKEICFRPKNFFFAECIEWGKYARDLGFDSLHVLT